MSDNWGEVFCDEVQKRKMKMDDYKGTLEQGDLDWIDGVINDAHQLDNMLSVGRAQRIMNTIAELKAENVRLYKETVRLTRVKMRLRTELDAIDEV